MGKIEVSFPAASEKQKLFLQDRHRFVAFGGARGGGKSWAVRVKAIGLCYAYKGIKVCIIRRSYPELRQNHIQPILNLLPKGSYRYNDGHKEIYFPGGSSIAFRYLATESDKLNFQGAEYDVIFLDEATQLTEDFFQVLQACNRGANDLPKRFYITCNPGGPGHSWVKRLFIDRKYKPEESAEDYSFIAAGLKDNPALMRMDPTYGKRLDALAPKLRRAWRDGDWNIFEGQFFEEFTDDPEHYYDRRYTHVIKGFEPPPGWKIYRSFDFGYAKPFSVAWWAIDYDGVLYRILELYGCTETPNEGLKWPPPRIFEEVRKTELEHPWLKGKHIYGVADPSIWDSSRGISVADEALRKGISFVPGDNNRLPGWMQVHYRLHFDGNGFPMMYVFDTCRGFIRTIPTLTYDEHRPEDLDTDGEDHIADEVRYMCMARPIAPQKDEEPDPFYKSPQYEIFGLQKEELTERSPRMKTEIRI